MTPDKQRQHPSQWARIPKGRFLYQKSTSSGQDWPILLSHLDTFLEHSGRWQKASPFISLIYFFPTTHASFPQEESWVGREVIGSASLPSIPMGQGDHRPLPFYLQDLQEEHAWSTPWPHTLEELNASTLRHWEKDIRSSLSIRHILAKNWRLQIFVEGTAFLLVKSYHFPKE